MKIIILGAGQVGKSLAEALAIDDNDITIVDSNSEALVDLHNRLDIRIITGHASHPFILESAGSEDADMLVAVTSSDEVNIVACRIVKHTKPNIKTISRIRANAYLQNSSELFQDNLGAMPIDVIISPETLLTNHVRLLIENPCALQVLEFANGLVHLVAVKARTGGPLVGHPIADLRQHMPSLECRVAAIFRDGQPIVPEGNTIIRLGDEVFFIAAKEHIRDVMSEMGKLEKPYKKIMIAGGGNIGERLARHLSKKFKVKVLEHDLNRCEALANVLDQVTILHGNASDNELLLEENIEDTDVFCALTNDDEANIMGSMLAKRLGVRTVMTLINNPAYMDLMQDGTIDIAISPQQTTASRLLTHVRRGDIANVHSLRRGAAEALETIVHGDTHNSLVIGRRLEEITLPQGASFGAIVRKERVIMAHHDVVIENDDHVILFLTDRHQIGEVESLFTGSLKA